MAALITACNPIGEGAWRYEWSGTAPFGVYAMGRTLLSGSTDTSIVVQWDDGETHTEPPAIELQDADGYTPDAGGIISQIVYAPGVSLQFRGRTTNSYYTVEQYIGAAWEVVAVIQETAAGYYSYTAPYLIAGTYQFRVTPYDITATAGTPLAFTLIHHTAPAPELTYSYNAGTGIVTVSA